MYCVRSQCYHQIFQAGQSTLLYMTVWVQITVKQDVPKEDFKARYEDWADSSLSVFFIWEGWGSKGSTACRYLCSVVWRWKDWVSGCLCADIRRAFQLWRTCVTVECIFQVGRDKTSLIIKRHGRWWQKKHFKTSGTCSYNRVLTFAPQTKFSS